MKKKILALVLVISFVMSMFALSFTSSAVSTLKGDANGDGELSTNDALLVLRVAAGIEDSLSTEAKSLCDIDGDGYISLFDARRILRAAAGLTNLEPTGAFQGYTDENNIFSSNLQETSSSDITTPGRWTQCSLQCQTSNRVVCTMKRAGLCI